MFVLIQNKSKDRSNYYKSVKEASIATKKLNICSWNEYLLKCHLDERLPYCPNVIYSKEWSAFGGWSSFLSENDHSFYLSKLKKYKTIEDASIAAKKLGISSFSDYTKMYLLDSRLPANPKKYYSDEWDKFGGWDKFINKIKIYSSYDDASKSVKKLGIKSAKEYNQKRYLDPRLPSKPQNKYESVWCKNGGWMGFLGTLQVKA